MKHLNILDYKKNVKCICCDSHGFYIETPSGADFITCPLCNTFTEFTINKEDFELLNNVINHTPDKIYEYCDDCKILFGASHQHNESGCTDSIYHAIFISRYSLDNIIYEGLPKFNSLQELNDLLESGKLKILDCSCTCNNDDYCEFSYYNIDKLKEKTIDCKLTYKYQIIQINKIKKWYNHIINP